MLNGHKQLDEKDKRILRLEMRLIAYNENEKKLKEERQQLIDQREQQQKRDQVIINKLKNKLNEDESAALKRMKIEHKKIKQFFRENHIVWNDNHLTITRILKIK